MAKDFEQKPEFSRTVAADRIGDSDVVEEIAASEEERAALAERFGWLSIGRLTATVRLRRLKPDLIRVSGRYEAELEQPCVVTLDPVAANPAGEFSLLYAQGRAAEREEEDMAPTDEDPPEPIVGGQIDIGEAVVQQLAVALDPYPRAPGAALPEELTDSGAGNAGGCPNPFEALAALKRKD